MQFADGNLRFVGIGCVCVLDDRHACILPKGKVTRLGRIDVLVWKFWGSDGGVIGYVVCLSVSLGGETL